MYMYTCAFGTHCFHVSARAECVVRAVQAVTLFDRGSALLWLMLELIYDCDSLLFPHPRCSVSTYYVLVLCDSLSVTPRSTIGTKYIIESSDSPIHSITHPLPSLSIAFLSL